MEKNKILFTYISLLLCSFMLTACDFSNSGTSSVDTSDSDNTSTTQPALVSMTNYFKNDLYVEYNTVNTTVQDFSGLSENFNTLLDRQIQLLSQDLLYRLFAIYGTNIAPDTNQNYRTLTYNDDMVLTYQNHAPYIYNNAILKTPYQIISGSVYYVDADGNIFNGSPAVYSPHIDDVAQYAISYNSASSGYLITNVFQQTNAIMGGCTFNDYYDIFFQDFNRADYAWNWNYTGLDIEPIDDASTAFLSYYNAFNDTLKLALANLLNNSINLDYNTCLNQISTLGIPSGFETKLQNYVEQTIIGTDLLQADETRYNQLLQLLGGDILTIQNYTLLNEPQTADLHYFRSYKTLIPAIVHQTLHMVFDTTTTSIYLSKNRVENTQTTTTLNTMPNVNYTLIRLDAKADNTPLTKLQIRINGINTSLLSVRYSIKTSSSASPVVNNQAMTLPSGTAVTLELDLSHLAAYKLSKTGSITFAITNAGSETFNFRFNGYYNSI